MTGPCSWSIPDPLCCDCWETVSPAVQAAAVDYATTVLWASTGRQFGLCEVTVRPCGYDRCNDGTLNWLGWSWWGGTWTPYILNGVWYNCSCPGLCTCDPRCQIWLPGPVYSITEVLQDGAPVDPGTYRVDDASWLVKNDPDTNGCWPKCPDMNAAGGSADAFEVTYMRGTPVPSALLTAASTLACEWVKGCTGDSSCRLSSRVVAMSRQGVDFQLVSPETLLENGFVGIGEIDQLIAAYNPNGLQRRLRVFSTNRPIPRTQTWP